jgi:membrane dipeptidase
VGTGDSGPLTAKGIELLKEFGRLGMILDATHSSDPSFYQALDLFAGPVMASHNNCRALVPGDRQFSDEQIKLLIQRDAVIGAAFDAWMLQPGFVIGKTEGNVVPLAAVADHIDHICQLAGNTNHVAIGTDLDGGFGTEQSPGGLETIADLQKLDGIFAQRGYTPADIDGIFHGNWLKFFSKNLPA